MPTRQQKKYDWLKKRKLIFSFYTIVFILIAGYFSYTGEIAISANISPYPYGKNFAFTITDDADSTRLHKIKPVYDFLDNLGMRTTVAIWVKDAKHSDGIPEQLGVLDYGDTCQNKDYLAYIKELQKKGFEVALHTVSGGTDYRDETIEGYEEFKRLFGKYPKMNIMHANNLENVYWGANVFKNKLLRRIITAFSQKAKLSFGGEDPEGSFFWGDVLKEKTKYVRMWGTSDINTLKFNPSMPYHDPNKPYVNYWFSFSDGFKLKFFNKLIKYENIQKLVKERGTSIVYTHFGKGFTRKDGKDIYRLNDDFKNNMDKLAKQKEGWFVPASTLLDRLLLMKNISIFRSKNNLTVVNSSKSIVEGVTILVRPETVLYNSHRIKFEANDEGEIILGDLKPGEAVTLAKEKDYIYQRKVYPVYQRSVYPGHLEYFNLILRRALIWFTRGG